MRLFAISDLHLANKSNRNALLDLPAYKEDWLILAGDTGETTGHLHFALSVLTLKFKQVVWVPGNHDLWTFPLEKPVLKGEEKYLQMVSICRSYNVITPEDAYPKISLNQREYIIAPCFTLYDYSFRPEDIPFDQAVNWSAESGVVCSDEELLSPYPYPSKAKWCEFRCELTESRLSELPANIPLILVNHYPVLKEHACLLRFPRFILWCGSTRTKDWINKFNIQLVIYGHMHIRGTRHKENVRFEEVSFGYPRDWDDTKGMSHYLKEIIP